jgi:hypothetical protein
MCGQGFCTGVFRAQGIASGEEARLVSEVVRRRNFADSRCGGFGPPPSRQAAQNVKLITGGCELRMGGDWGSSPRQKCRFNLLRREVELRPVIKFKSSD